MRIGRTLPDPIPQIKTAGTTSLLTEESAGRCIQADLYQECPSTPEHIKRFRKSFQNQPGVKQTHPGMFHDINKLDLNKNFGKKTLSGDHVDQVIKAQNLSGLAERFNDIKEAKYSSNVREPLGRGYERGYQWPERVKKDEFRFGNQTFGSESAKEVLYPQGGALEEKIEVASMYRRTHGNFGPGEQKDRGYQWPVDWTGTRFGYKNQNRLCSTADSIHNERAEGSFPKTVIVKKTVEDYKAVNADDLGRPKNLGQGRPPLPAGHAFGMRNVTGIDTWNAAKCIQGEPSQRDLEPDKDLGKSVRPGSRYQHSQIVDSGRVFGVPTIRTDVPFKEKKSVADYQNYGDEPEAIDLLFPSSFTEIGITEQDFQLPRPKDEIKTLFAKVGVDYKIGKFNAVYNRAKNFMTNRASGSDMVSVRAFMTAVSEMHTIE